MPKHDKQFIQKFIDELEVVVVNFFVPLFFANTGLRTDLTTLRSSVGPVLLVWALATIGKMLPPLVLGFPLSLCVAFSLSLLLLFFFLLFFSPTKFREMPRLFVALQFSVGFSDERSRTHGADCVECCSGKILCSFSRSLSPSVSPHNKY